MQKQAIFSVIILMSIFISCKKKNDSPIPNTNPSIPVISNGPDNNAQNIETPITFSWIASTDPDGGTITYDVYLGVDQNNLAVVSLAQAETSYTSDQLEPEILYYFKIIAKDEEGGISESEIRKFTTSTSGSFTDNRDGAVYKTIKIGTQVWMAENLNFNLPGESWYYNNNPANGAIYGRLYTWAALSNAIPSGWHLPSDDEWKTLEEYLGMSTTDLNKSGYSVTRGTDQGTKLQAGGSASMNIPLSGYRSGGAFTALGNRTYLWVNTTIANGDAYRRRLVTNEPYVYRFTNPNAGFAISVRLIKD